MIYKCSRFFILAIFSFIVLFSGCSKSSKDSNPSAGAQEKVEAANEQQAFKLAAEGKLADAASEYARIGELLLLPEGLQYADKMFDKALELDSNNGKANLYSALTKPLTKFQGFITRLGPIAEEKEAKKLAQLKRDIEKLNLPELTKFANQLPEGKVPFSNYRELQLFLKTDILPELVKSTDKLSRIVNRKDLELNINLHRFGLGRSITKYSSSCYKYSSTYTISNGGGYDRFGNAIPKVYEQSYWSCYYYSDVNLNELLKAERVLLDQADLKILRGSVMALADAIRLNSAYSFDGLQEAVVNLKQTHLKRRSQSRDLTTRDILQEVERHSELFKIENDHELLLLAKSQEQVLRDALALGELQNELCQNPDRQKGENLIKSLCLFSDDLKRISILLDLLIGPKPVTIGYDSFGEPVDVVFNLLALINTPPQDLKTLFPTNYDRKGNPVRWTDPSFNGIIPNSDLVEKLEKVVFDKIKFPKIKL